MSLSAHVRPPAAAVEPDTISTLPAALLYRALRSPRQVALRKKHLGVWRSYTWGEYAERAAAIGMGLRRLGVQPGDRVAVHAGNRPAWVIADMGIQAIGAVTVGLYPTAAADEVAYLLEHSESVVLIAEDEEQYDKTAAVRSGLVSLRNIVIIDPRGVDLADSMLMSFDDLEAEGRRSSDDLLTDLAAAVAELDPALPATIVYTSGTTGPPKGAMLSHANLVAASRNGESSFGVAPGDEVLSYLPLCHVAERLVSVVCALASDYVVNFGEDSDTFNQDLREVQPTFFLGVPRVWEKMMASATIKIGDAGLLKRSNYRLWLSIGRGIARRRWARGRLGPVDRMVYGFGWLMLYRPLREMLGLSRCRSAVSGAAPIAPEVLEYFWSIGIPVVEGYGQTENTAQGSIVAVDNVRLGTVGRAVPETELRLDPGTGEILTRGPATFLGYFKDQEATSTTIDADGWLHTGDVGVIDDDGMIRIVDRMKDIIITAGGKNISPSEIENKLKVSPHVREAIVIGDRRKYLTALIGIELDTVGAWAQSRGIPFTTYTDLSSNPAVVELVGHWVEEVNQSFAQVETVKRFAMLPRELDTEEGEVTATQKVKRRSIEATYASLIEELYT
ncbi:AMP-dependent synthetase/ligase [Nocardioides sp. YJ-D4]